MSASTKVTTFFHSVQYRVIENGPFNASALIGKGPWGVSAFVGRPFHLSPFVSRINHWERIRQRTNTHQSKAKNISFSLCLCWARRIDQKGWTCADYSISRICNKVKRSKNRSAEMSYFSRFSHFWSHFAPFLRSLESALMECRVRFGPDGRKKPPFSTQRWKKKGFCWLDISPIFAGFKMATRGEANFPDRFGKSKVIFQARQWWSLDDDHGH